MSNENILTVEQMREAGICLLNISRFEELFGEETNITIAKARKYAEHFDFYYGGRLLEHGYKLQFEQQRSRLWNKFREQCRGVSDKIPHDCSSEAKALGKEKLNDMWKKYSLYLDKLTLRRKKNLAEAWARAFAEMRWAQNYSKKKEK